MNFLVLGLIAGTLILLFLRCDGAGCKLSDRKLKRKITVFGKNCLDKGFSSGFDGCVTIGSNNLKKRQMKRCNKLKQRLASCDYSCLKPVDGGWCVFGDWSVCSAKCGEGTQTRIKTCINPPPVDGGAYFQGNAEDTRPCNSDACLYEIKDLGCWKDARPRAIQPLDEICPTLMDSYEFRANAYEKCLEVTMSLGYKVFALQNGGWCASAPDAENTYQKYGGSSACRVDGEGGEWANQVYKINSVVKPVKKPQFEVEDLGCWTDTRDRAIQPLEDKYPTLLNGYRCRANAYEKCFKVTMNLGYQVFALQNGGWCASAPDAENTYQKYGGSSACRVDGEGGEWANQVYKIYYSVKDLI